MWNKLLVVFVATAGLAVAAAVNADARGMGGRGEADVGFQGRAATGHAGFNARAESRESDFRPHGWSEGRKTGWHCRVGAHRCIPPGLR
jgi:hypothetical protein